MSLSWSGPVGRARVVLGGEARVPRAQTDPCLSTNRSTVDVVCLDVETHVSDTRRVFDRSRYVQGVKSVMTSASLSLRSRVKVDSGQRVSFGLPSVDAFCSDVEKPELSNVEAAMLNGNLEALEIGMVLPPPMIEEHGRFLTNVKARKIGI